MPGTDIRIVYSVGFSPFTVSRMALSMALSSLSKAQMKLKEQLMEAHRGIYPGDMNSWLLSAGERQSVEAGKFQTDDDVFVLCGLRYNIEQR